MKPNIISLVLLIFAPSAIAQVPNFGKPAGEQNLYGYSAIKYRANTNAWENYSTLQYGITDYLAIGGDAYSDGIHSYLGYTIRTGFKKSDWFSIGAQITPSFNIADNHKFEYVTYALYMNGSISKDSKLFWVTDTWLEQNRSTISSLKQWSYIGYSFDLPGRNNSITPMVGIIHSWMFDQQLDIPFGVFFTHNNISLYAWANDILTNDPRFCFAFDFKFTNAVV